MKKFSKVLALGLATTMLGGVFVGCSSEQSGELMPQKDANVESNQNKEEGSTEKTVEPVTLRVVSQFGGTDPNAVTFENNIEKFQQDNPNVTVENESATADETWKSNVLTDFAAGNEPDVILYRC